jgi:Zn-dependent protease
MRMMNRRLLLACYGNVLLLCSLLLPLIPAFTVSFFSTQPWHERIPKRRTKLWLSSPQQQQSSDGSVVAVAAASSSGLDTTGISVRSNDLQIHRNKLAESLEKINKLQTSLSQAKEEDDINALEKELDNVEKQASIWIGALVPPVGLALPDYAKAIDVFVRLPFRMRVAICVALELEGYMQTASNWERVPEIVALWYDDDQKQQRQQEQRQQPGDDEALLTPQRIQSAMKAVEVTLADDRVKSQQPPSKGTLPASSRGRVKSNSKDIIQSIFSPDKRDKDELAIDATVQQLFGRVTRKEGRVATQQDLEILQSALDNRLFLASEKPAAINGGYIIRGKNQKKTSADLVQALDKKLPAAWSCQVCYIQDDFSRDDDGTKTLLVGGDNDDKLLLLLKKDMSATTNPWIFTAASAAALCIAFLFSVGVYGGNDAFQTNTILTSDQTALLLDDLDKVWQVFLSLGAIQLLHDLGQWIVAKQYGMKTSLPTLLPTLGLPYLNSMVKIEESPKNFRALFDYAIIGPLLGLGASLIFLVTGLQLTLLADAATVQQLPALPVNVLCISTLGATLIDYLFGGGPGFVSLQDPQSFVQLHPLAIAGFLGLIMNALEVLPLGGTDGGRMSLAVFGRSGHSIISGFTWLILLVAALFLERGDALVGAWAVYNIACSDTEIPCRDEVEQIDLTRALAAGALWFLAILAIAPL